MAKMVSMKGTGVGMPEAPISARDDDYPMGLRLHLESAQIEALGFEMLPDPGGSRMLLARVQIVSTDSCQDKDGTQRSMALQITDMKLTEDDAGSGAADRLYGTPSSD